MVDLVVKAALPGGKSHLPVIWSDMTPKLAWFWQTHIQPVIKNETGRADKHWHWPTFLRAMKPLHRIRGQKPILLTLSAKSPSNKFCPIGMLFMLSEYPAIYPSHGNAVFTYFITAAPMAALSKFGFTEAPSVGRILLDAGIVNSIRHGWEGNTWLHCAPAGKEKLLEYYENKCMLNRFPQAAKLPVRKKNDGRYFFTDAALAGRLVSELNSLRT